MKPIADIAGMLSIPEDFLIPYGRHIAKVDSRLMRPVAGRPDGALVLVTSMSPTPAGEGKTTLAIGLTESLRLLGKKAVACIRQPSLGPFFGLKGGATGSGLAGVEPRESITIQFTGDDCAVATSHNFISSVIDNHLHHGNRLRIDTKRILWKRASTVNDRALRSVRVGCAAGAVPRDEEFIISAASELMSVLCLSRGISEFKEMASAMIVAFTLDGDPVTVRDLGVGGAVAALFKDAIHPNLVQSTEGAPVFIHGGPFGNISLGCSSLAATSLALKLSDFVVTEAGFSTELGAEKFFDIKCRRGGLRPNAAVIVATLRALRLHGGAPEVSLPGLDFALKGLPNLEKHVENVKRFGVPCLVALNRFEDDRADELEAVRSAIADMGVKAHIVDVRNAGGRGGLEVADELARLASEKSAFKPLYPLEAPLEDKIKTVAVEMYGASGVMLTPEAVKNMEELQRLGLGRLPVCMAKTHKSISDDARLFGRPESFTVNVRRVLPAAGAGFLVAMLGGVLLMPGLPEHPNAESIDIDSEGNISAPF